MLSYEKRTERPLTERGKQMINRNPLACAELLLTPGDAHWEIADAGADFERKQL